jgi:hypothetical protein
MPYDGFAHASLLAIDGSKFKAVNNRDKNFTRAKMDRPMAQIEESVARYCRSSIPRTGDRTDERGDGVGSDTPRSA